MPARKCDERLQERVAAIGATIGWTFKAGELPISTRIEYLHEFAAENRPEGDAVYLNDFVAALNHQGQIVASIRAPTPPGKLPVSC